MAMATNNNNNVYSGGGGDIDDIEEFVWADEASTNMPWDRFGLVFDLMQKGNRAYRESRLEEAIHCFSKANNDKPGDPVILSNRSAAFSRISRSLKNRPASDSEYQPVNGLDPTTHAELALKDAEKVLGFRSNSAKSYLLKANALMLLERYEEARETLLSGLQVDPLSKPLQFLLRSLEATSASTIRRTNNGKPLRTDEYDCTLCLKLLYEPITTPCGHSFCRSCLFQSMDHGNKCPMCRTVLFISPKTYSVSVTLKNIIQKNFPEEYSERKLENDTLTNLGVDLMPLFVMDVVLPCQKMSLNIFEPRYRLMVRRIMEGNHRMGMVALDSGTGAVADFACEVEITECEPLPDGRFYLEVEGRRRFRILRSWDQDGYRIAEVEWIQDIFPLEGTVERLDLQEMTRDAAELARGWIRRAREAAPMDKTPDGSGIISKVVGCHRLEEIKEVVIGIGLQVLRVHLEMDYIYLFITKNIERSRKLLSLLHVCDSSSLRTYSLKSLEREQVELFDKHICRGSNMSIFLYSMLLFSSNDNEEESWLSRSLFVTEEYMFVCVEDFAHFSSVASDDAFSSYFILDSCCSISSISEMVIEPRETRCLTLTLDGVMSEKFNTSDDLRKEKLVTKLQEKMVTSSKKWKLKWFSEETLAKFVVLLKALHAATSISPLPVRCNS